MQNFCTNFTFYSFLRVNFSIKTLTNHSKKQKAVCCPNFMIWCQLLELNWAELNWSGSYTDDPSALIFLSQWIVNLLSELLFEMLNDIHKRENNFTFFPKSLLSTWIRFKLPFTKTNSELLWMSSREILVNTTDSNIESSRYCRHHIIPCYGVHW